jgi:hypothetical protein
LKQTCSLPRPVTDHAEKREAQLCDVITTIALKGNLQEPTKSVEEKHDK